MAYFDIDPRSTALIIVDMQSCFVENSPVAAPGGRALLSTLNDLADVFRRAGALVVYTALVVRPDGSNVGVIGQTVPPVKGGLIDDGAPSAALHSDLRITDADVVIKKPLFGAFTMTDLDLVLRRRDIDTVVIGGIATNVCCESTAREAMQRDYRVVFLSDGTATFDLPDTGLGAAKAEEVQRVTCATLGVFFAEVTTVEDVARRLPRAADSVRAASEI
jgi:ureidoacrylate peracid hydrolase